MALKVDFLVVASLLHQVSFGRSSRYDEGVSSRPCWRSELKACLGSEIAMCELVALQRSVLAICELAS